MSLFLFGATGGLGMEVAKGLVTAEGFKAKKAVVRDASSDQAKALSGLGWELVEFNDVARDTAGLTNVLKGAKTVVSTVSGNDMVALETNIVKAAKAAGASLFVPSQFGVDVRRWGTEFPFLAGKKAVLDAAEAEGLPTLKVFVGYFSDWIFGFFCDLENSKVTLIGDGTDMISFTLRSDIGYVLAKALADPKYANGGYLSMQGDLVSLLGAVKLLGKARGKDFTVDFQDPTEAKKEEDALLAKGLQGDIGGFFGAFKMHLMGEPARGNAGVDLSAEATNYGHNMKTLEEVFNSGVYSS